MAVPSSSRNVSIIGDVFEQELFQFISTSCKDDLIKILRDPREEVHYPVVVSLVDMNLECGNSTSELLRYPDKVLTSGDRALYRAQLFIHQSFSDENNIIKKEELKIKQHVHLRIHRIPQEGIDRYFTTFPDSVEVGTFMAIHGIVGKTCRSGPKEFKKDYWCNKCKNITTFHAPRSRYYAFPDFLDACENHCVGAKVSACKLGVEGFTAKDAHRFKDCQEIKLQEQIATQGDSGGLQNTLWVVLEDDLVDCCKPGDEVVITGTLYTRFKPFRANQPIDVSLAFMANHVEIKNDKRKFVMQNERLLGFFQDFWKHYEHDPFEGRNFILKSFCPQVFGMYFIKLALSVVLAGGVSKEENGSRARGESHMLLVGDPGIAKSQFLKYASKLIPGSIFTSGTGCTSAGLTVAAVMENGSWSLEAGALVLADRAICCIDEFSTMKDQDRTSLHEAMEQQTISIAKGGMIAKLSTRCTILAATNPKPVDNRKKTDEDDDDMNIGLSSPLLSRFDLVMIMKDEFCEELDESLCDFILGNVNKTTSEATNIWDTDILQSYMLLIKGKNPQIGADAETILSRYYHTQRNSPNRLISRTSVRLLESLHRLAEGHARFMFRDDVTIHDAIYAVTLMEASMQSSSLTTDFPNPMRIVYPPKAIKEYYHLAKNTLQILKLPEIWEKEKLYLEDLVNNKKSPPAPPPLPPSSLSQVTRSRQQKAPPNNNFFEVDGANNDMPCSLRFVPSSSSKTQQNK